MCENLKTESPKDKNHLVFLFFYLCDGSFQTEPPLVRVIRLPTCIDCLHVLGVVGGLLALAFCFLLLFIVGSLLLACWLLQIVDDSCLLLA